MMQNDYRRALIMLRGIEKGMTGHVRLEKRTLTGTLQFSVSGAAGNDPLYAALMRVADGDYRGIVLGQLGRDGRGQAGINATFDPRDINGLEFEQYDIIAVIRGGDNGPCLSMYGFVNGAVDINWTRMREAVAKILGREAAGTCPEPEAEKEPVVALQAPLAESASVMAAFPEAVPEAFPEADPVIMAVKVGENGALLDEAGNAVEIEKEKMPAGLLLDVDITDPWPESIEQLRGVFLDEASFTPFEAEGFVFVRAPLPENAMTDYCAVGIKCEDNAPTHVCYAIPGSDPSDPPPGLEEYTWEEGENGGWWRICLNVETGETAEM